MTFFVDECVYHITTQYLRQLGYQATTVQEVGLIGSNDEDVLNYAVSKKMIFLTRDMHFSNIYLFPPHKTYGIIVLKIKPFNCTDVHLVLKHFLNNHTRKDLKQTLVIVDQNKYRMRR